MGRSPAPLGPTDRCRRLLDGPPARGRPREEDGPVAPPGRLDRAGRVLPRAEGTPPMPTDPVEGGSVADLRQLWLSLPEHDKAEFEGHFSRMVLRLFHGLPIDGGRR